MFRQVNQPLYYVVRRPFGSYNKQGLRVQVSSGAVLRTDADCRFYPRDIPQGTEWEPLRFTLSHAQQVLPTHEVFGSGRPSFSFHVWGPYTEEVFQAGLWMFRGFVGRDESNFSLEAVGCCETYQLNSDEELTFLSVGSNLAAIRGAALLIRTREGCLLATTVDLNRLLPGVTP